MNSTVLNIQAIFLYLPLPRKDIIKRLTASLARFMSISAMFFLLSASSICYACDYCIEHPGEKECRYWAGDVEQLVPIIIQAESSGDPTASDGKSYGLMGISQCVLTDYCDSFYPKIILQHEDMFSPTLNKAVGTWYLRKIQSWLPKEYRNSKAHIIYCYNTGIGKLKKNNWQIPSWTKNHPNRIYRKIFRGEI